MFASLVEPVPRRRGIDQNVFRAQGQVRVVRFVPLKKWFPEIFAELCSLHFLSEFYDFLIYAIAFESLLLLLVIKPAVILEK